ncbi:molybdopterin guanine dinucleotide-containing S/N-oxide reductase [Parapusillimonas granuli]|uniref:Molybdopterin-dependent oxidoreductase n=1 Tax=Parapusillimonas granuli TaxID=380911 RepID=A0A853FY94_9BURK|nr:molybdopterin guanine dinucleotide-containing S/N-oxide reductase [Parapusillimonas granuli]MBB5216139.1 biotin/methionine sulfoxide reductase [Parapusillimonas granuli]NYT47820.1 molybdopterin-dependent oxidoreductase [Parapusillimonas granuli]
MLQEKEILHSSHWGAFYARPGRDGLQVRPYEDDPNPSPVIGNFTDALNHPARIRQPMVRKGWLERGPTRGADRNGDTFVAVSWERAFDLVARELRRVRDEFGAGQIFGGSYGWASAGRFHHTQSQIHRFLNTCTDGYVRSVNSYSAGASTVLLPHVAGPFDDVSRRGVTWRQIEQYTDCVIAFGGMATKNSMVASGGISHHIEEPSMAAARRRGCHFINVSPLRTDLPEGADAEWVPIRPGTDVALMLALVHELVAMGRHDRAFLSRYCVGWDRFQDYVLGTADRQPKDPRWAAGITGIDAGTIRALAARLTQGRVLVTVSHSLQRSEHGEQPVWMGLVLAAALGQIGLPGGGYSYALGTIAHYGRLDNRIRFASLPQGRNPVQAFIPVARISDMLLNPGQEFDYDGAVHRYPEIRLVYWAGGNPFHHHQQLARLRDAFRRPETIIVHEVAWTATARHADIVLPCTMTLERDDLGVTQTDSMLIAMKRVAAPYAQARDDYDIFAELAKRLERHEAFTEGRDTMGWLRWIYSETQRRNASSGQALPDFDTFWEQGRLELQKAPDDGGMFRRFREDPAAHPLPTPSGRIEIVSERIAGFRYEDCPGHPAWLAKRETPTERYPLWLIANQPATRLHSQLDFARYSQSNKRHGREVCTMHPADAAARGISDGGLVRLYNERGGCQAAVRLSEDVMPGVAQLPTGAWYDPIDPSAARPECRHGNPNVLTGDLPTSALSQGCSGQLARVEIERLDAEPEPVRAFVPPPFISEPEPGRR